MFNPVVSLPRYAELIGYDECAFFGIAYEGQEEFSCTTFWSEWQRQNVANALMQAQKLIENYVGYPLAQTWITGEEQEGKDARYVDQQPFARNPVLTKWCRVISGGVRAESTIAAAAPLTYSGEYATAGPVAATITATSEVKLFYPGTDRPIVPSSVTYAGGNLTVTIPKCRLLLAEVLQQVGPDTGADNDDLALFLTTVEIVREYNDPSVQAVLVKAHVCDALCVANNCEHQTGTGCILVRSAEIGKVEIHPGTYADGAWGRAAFCGPVGEVRLNYRAGLRYLPADLENVLIRLAHSLMPEEPCGCAVTQNLWKRDHHVPEILTRERINCPFGYNDGAWFAYTWAKNNKVLRGMAI